MLDAITLKACVRHYDVLITRPPVAVAFPNGAHAHSDNSVGMYSVPLAALWHIDNLQPICEYICTLLAHDSYAHVSSILFDTSIASTNGDIIHG